MMQFSKLNEKKESWYSTVSFMCVILLVFMIAFYLLNFVFMHVEVIGPSMEDTLRSGDTLWVYRTKDVKVGDIIVFDHDVTGNGRESLIKRVIAVGGERVSLEGHTIKAQGIDGKWRVAHTGFTGTWDNPTSFIVPENYFFAMGDNINISLDSTEKGCFPISDISGRVL